MYNNTSIQSLVDLVGWGLPVMPNTQITLTDANKKSDSGRFFNSFHQLATVENVFDCISNLDVDSNNLNVFLAKVKRDAVLDVLSKVFDKNILANTPSTEEFISLNYAVEYDAMIADKKNVLVEAIGYRACITILELFITSIRSNVTLKVLKADYNFLQSEVSGIRDVNGRLLTNGIENYYNVAITDAISILFPKKTVDTKKTLTARNKIW